MSDTVAGFIMLFLFLLIIILTCLDPWLQMKRNTKLVRELEKSLIREQKQRDDARFCAYCKTSWKEDKFHPSTCEICGAPQGGK